MSAVQPTATESTEKTTTDSTPVLNTKTFEEEDEFEDFPADDWPSSATLTENANVQNSLWEENWDDVEVDDNFTNELRAELERYKKEHQS